MFCCCFFSFICDNKMFTYTFLRGFGFVRLFDTVVQMPYCAIIVSCTVELSFASISALK